MATTLFDYISRAALSLGGEPISSFEDDSRENQIFENIWEPELNTCLTLGNWNFASKDFSLSRLVDAPDDLNYTYQFTLPADFLVARYAMDEGGTRIEKWTIQADRLYADEQVVRLKYVRRYTQQDIETPPGLPDWFGDLYVTKLALRACEPMTGKTTLRQAAQAEYETALGRARRRDGIDAGPGRTAIRPSLWHSARSGA